MLDWKNIKDEYPVATDQDFPDLSELVIFATQNQVYVGYYSHELKMWFVADLTYPVRGVTHWLSLPDNPNKK